MAVAQVEWLDLAEEEWKKCLQWVKAAEPIVPSVKEAEGVPGAPEPPPVPAPPPAPVPRARTSQRAPSGYDAVGWQVSVFWAGDNTNYDAVVLSYDPDTGTLLSFALHFWTEPSSLPPASNKCNLFITFLDKAE